MSKRSRAIYEAELQAQQSPFVTFGTALPPLDPAVRDDGSYVPVWKQEVRDDKGRRRLHGAFTGGWSAGYYNTVGSKEGWTPATFVSSRTNRRKDQPAAQQHRPEDYMDEEDLADAEEARKIETSHAFAGLGLTEDDDAAAARAAASSLAGLFRVEGENMGTKLLKKMGWKEGQGIGPKVRRAAQLGVGQPGQGDQNTHLFAPENTVVVRLVKKTDRKGLGYEGAARLSRPTAGTRDDDSDDERDNDSRSSFRSGLFGRPRSSKKEKKARSGGIGIGVLNDTGSDDEDPYDMGPRISFNRTIGGDKKKKAAPKPASDAPGRSKFAFSKRPPNPLLGKIAGSSSSSSSVRRCHDGRPALAGFVLGRTPDALTTDMNAAARFPPPAIPPGWKSAKLQQQQRKNSYVSTADAAKASAMDPRARAAVLGEGQLPGKSVFDFLSPAARDRIAAATGRTDLPEARSEVPAAYRLSETEKQQQLLQQVPMLDKATAVAAISRGARGGGPYPDDEAKRARYRAYLEYQAGIASALPPPKASHDDWLRECHEFYNCARIFRPMSGTMASRFTTGTTAGPSGPSAADGSSLVTRPLPKPQDPAEEAAKMGMYGPLTRSTQDFYPARLLCKRLGVKPPAVVQPEGDTSSSAAAGNRKTYGATFHESRPWGTGSAAAAAARPSAAADVPTPEKAADPAAEVVVQADRNEALEGQRASDDVFRAVFGDSDNDDDEAA